MKTHHRTARGRGSVAAVRGLRTSHAYLRLLQVLEQLAVEGFLRRAEQQQLRDTADALLFGDADAEARLISAERVFRTILWRDELTEREVSILRERLWDIEPVAQRSLAS